MRNAFAMVADILFYAASAFVLSLCVLRYYRVTLWIALLCAALLAVAAALTVMLVMGRKRDRLLLTKREREAFDALMLRLALGKSEEVNSSLSAAFRADGKESEIAEGGLLVDGVPLYPCFTMEPLSADGIAFHIREHGAASSVACNALSAEAEKLASAFGLKVMRGDEVYALFNRTKMLPEPLSFDRPRTARRWARSFSKANARPFFVSGLLLLIMSLFTFFPLYYLISGSVLLLCSVAVRLFGFAK